MTDSEIEKIRYENYERIAKADNTLMLVEVDGQFEVHQHTPDSICPPSRYPSKRGAASRILQLMGIGPVAPQTWPEECCIGSIDTQPQEAPNDRYRR